MVSYTELVGLECGLLSRVSKMSPQNGGFIRVTELARRRFVGKAKPFFVFKTSQSSAHTIKFVLASMFFFWITFHFTSSVCLCVGYKMKPCTQISDSGSVEK